MNVFRGRCSSMEERSENTDLENNGVWESDQSDQIFGKYTRTKISAK